MEFSLREWLILIGLAIIVVILVDGFRRYKKDQKTNESNDRAEGSNGHSTVRKEPTYGHAFSDSKEAPPHDPVVNAFENARKTATSPLTEVPHVVDSGPTLERDTDMYLEELESLVEKNNMKPLSQKANANKVGDQQNQLDFGFSFNTEDSLEQEKDVLYDSYDSAGSVISIDDDHEDEDVQDIGEIEEVIVINILAPEDKGFSGMELLQLVLNCGMRYGDMDIFHRHEDGFDRGRVQFSMASAVEPGTFDLDKMGEMNCPGVSFFMGLPGPKNSMKAFDFMLETGQTLIRNLGGELHDERRSPMSEQTIDHCRQRIRDFERRSLARSK